MHVVSASAAFNVALPRAIRRPPVLSAILSAKMSNRLRAAGQALTLAIQALLFAAAMWLLLAAPALLPEQQSLAQAPAARQASR
jgi:hypothetical protein